MASQPNIQGYLERQRIGLLFEDLMQKLIKDMPNDPIPFLIKALQKKHDKQLGSYGKKSETDDFFESSNELRKSGGAYGEMAVEKHRTYDKPWQSNAKRLKTKKPQEGDAVDSQTLVKVALDDHSEFKSKHKKDDKSPQRKQKKRRSEEEDLALELKAPQSLRMKAVENGSSEFVDASRGKVKASTVIAANHRKELEKIAMGHKLNKDTNTAAEENDDSIDDADEMLEDAEELRKEGVSNVCVSGHKLSKKKGQSKKLSGDVKVGVCAWCARMLGGEHVADLRKSEVHSDSDTESCASKSSATTTKSSVILKNVRKEEKTQDIFDDDDFESVSQVSGPRAPVWEDNDSDAPTLTPRKGSHMLSKSLQPVKGRNMLAEFTGSMSPTPRSSRTVTVKKDQPFTPSHTWSGGAKVDKMASARSTDFFNQKRQGWNTVEDSEGSTIDIDTERPRSSRAYRK